MTDVIKKLLKLDISKLSRSEIRKLGKEAKKQLRHDVIFWVHQRLDDEWFANPPASGLDYGAWLDALGPELFAAQRGNLGPLLKKYPDWKPFLVAPSKRKTIRAAKFNSLTLGVWAMQRIPKIWKGTKYKETARELNKENKNFTAVEIAALWADPDQSELQLHKLMNEIQRRIKPSGKRRK